MTNIDPTEIAEFVNNLVDRSGDNIRKHFRNLDKIDSKDDQSPVTIADREAEQLMRDMIKQQYPDHGIQGEEFGVENGDAEYKWIIDPIDGTLSFMSGRPIFGTLIGLLKDSKPVTGVIDQPINHERWVAIEGQGCSYNGQKVSVRSCASLAEATLATTGPNYFAADELTKFNSLSDCAKHTIYGGDCYLYALIASGHLDLAIEPNCLKPHDFLPIIPIIKEAGGIITNWQGNAPKPDETSNLIIAGDERVHQQALEILG